MRKVEKVKKQCEVCGKEIFIYPRLVHQNRFCSRTCKARRVIAGWNKGKLAPWNKGHPISAAARAKISRYQREEGKRTSGEYRKMGLKGLLVQQSRKKPTKIEKIVYEYLSKLGIVFKKQHLINKKFLVDAYLPVNNIIIEIDGEYWHSLEKIMKKDKAENAYLQKCGFKLIRLSEKEVLSGKFMERIVV